MIYIIFLTFICSDTMEGSQRPECEGGGRGWVCEDCGRFGLGARAKGL